MFTTHSTYLYSPLAHLYAEHAAKSDIDADDIKLAIDAQLIHSFAKPPDKNMLLHMAEIKNQIPLPVIPEKFGIRAPIDRHNQLASNFQIVPQSHNSPLKPQMSNQQIQQQHPYSSQQIPTPTHQQQHSYSSQQVPTPTHQQQLHTQQFSTQFARPGQMRPPMQTPRPPGQMSGQMQTPFHPQNVPPQFFNQAVFNQGPPRFGTTQQTPVAPPTVAPPTVMSSRRTSAANEDDDYDMDE